MIVASVFEPLYQVIGWLLAFLYKLPPHSLGLAIILMTIIVMAVQLPLITKQTRSMILMQRIQPEIKKIQAQYKDDRQKMNEEMMRYYQENKINPLAGCLPLLLIVPIGFAVFGTFRNDGGIQAHVPRTGTFSQLYVDICGSETTPVKECTEVTKADPPAVFDFLGTELNVSAREAVKEGFLHALPWLVLLAIVVATGWYQTYQTQARQLRQGAPINKQMQTITRVMPLFFGFISFGLFAATTLYFAVSNIWRIGQQHFILNKMYEEEHPSGPKTKAVGAGESPSAGANGTQDKNGTKPGAKPGTNGGAAAKNPASSAARRKKKKKR